MKRDVIKDLVYWKNREEFKPLIIRGARQVGKSYIVRELGKNHFDNLVEINFERNPEIAKLFSHSDPFRILKSIEALKGVQIVFGKTLLFLDEIQAAPEILSKLRWFAEEIPKLHIIAAGSLLDFAIEKHEVSMPVGRVSFLFIEPMSFLEFLDAIGEQSLRIFLETTEISDGIDDVIHLKIMDIFKQYVIVGGMPAAVNAYLKSKSFIDAAEIQSNLLIAMREDFAKYGGRVPHPRLLKVLQAIPRQLSKKFMYTQIDRDETAASLKQALELLVRARICHKVQASQSTGLPLGADVNEKIFKSIFMDVGLVSTMLGLSMHEFDLGRLSNSGGIAEQVVGQGLRLFEAKNIDPQLYYWVREKKGSEAEVDYIIQNGSTILPIEVKSGSSGTLKSLHHFMEMRQLKTAVRFNSERPSVTQVTVKISNDKTSNYQLVSLPIYWVTETKRLLKTLNS
jgi:predicted AAA+ superfamily ATPase